MVAGDAVPARSWELARRCREEALDLERQADERGLTLRVIGSLAVQLRSPTAGSLMEVLGRRPCADVDLLGYSRQQRKLEAMFQGGGWELDPIIRQAQEYGVKRLIYRHPAEGVKVDVFLDQLVMSHTIDFRGRLELDRPTVPLADLLLSKLQIQEVTENDLIDGLVLLAEHDLGDGGEETIELARVVGVLSSDWGFWRTATGNLARLTEAIGRYAASLDAAAGELAAARAGALRRAIEAAPKSRRWRLRSVVGTRMAWYEEVGDVERGER